MNDNQTQEYEADDNFNMTSIDDPALQYQIGKKVDEWLKLQNLGPVSEENVEHLFSQFAYDCYRTGYEANKPGEHPSSDPSQAQPSEQDGMTPLHDKLQGWTDAAMFVNHLYPDQMDITEAKEAFNDQQANT